MGEVTRLVTVREGTEPEIGEAAEYLRRGELVAFPTETVYGLGGDGLNAAACAKIYEVKQRPADNPLILHIAETEEVRPLVQLREAQWAQLRPMLEALWPGPLTLVLPRSACVPDVVTGGGDTVAIRMPAHPIARALLRAVKRPIAAPSANRSGRPSPTNAQDVWADLQGRIPLILDGGACSIGIESTVLDVGRQPAMILRPGFYTPQSFAPWLGEVGMDPALLEGGIPRSPGQKYRHYAPRAPLTLFVGSTEAVEAALRTQVEAAHAQGHRAGVLLFEGMSVPAADGIGYWGPAGDLTAMAQRLFAALREMDRHNFDVLFGIGIQENSEYATSIMNRLRKSAGGHVIKLD